MTPIPDSSKKLIFYFVNIPPPIWDKKIRTYGWQLDPLPPSLIREILVTRVGLTMHLQKLV